MSEDSDSPQARRRKPTFGGIQSIAKFQHGDLLTASDFNEIIDALKQLDRRLSKLEGGLG